MTSLYLCDTCVRLVGWPPYVEIGNVDASGYVIFYPDYDLDIALVEYNPTIMDKIMSWIISLGGRITQADKRLEFKVIEKK